MKSQKALLTKVDIDWLIDSMKFVFPTKAESTEKFSQVMEKLDKFVGDIQTKRTEQTLHSGQHRKLNDRLDKIDKQLHIS